MFKSAGRCQVNLGTDIIILIILYWSILYHYFCKRTTMNNGKGTP